jgi:hypothetical protein
MNSLQLLADHDREREAPPRVEARLIAQFRARKVRRKMVRLTLGTTVAAAAVVAALWLTPRLAPTVMPEIRVAPPASPAIEARRSLPPSVPRNRLLQDRPPSERPPREFVTEFFPLMDPAPPFERGQILRVDVPASAMRAVGLPVREERLADRVQADVLVGEEGMPRAIRFVSFETR